VRLQGITLSRWTRRCELDPPQMGGNDMLKTQMTSCCWLKKQQPWRLDASRFEIIGHYRPAVWTSPWGWSRDNPYLKPTRSPCQPLAVGGHLWHQHCVNRHKLRDDLHCNRQSNPKIYTVIGKVIRFIPRPVRDKDLVK